MTLGSRLCCIILMCLVVAPSWGQEALPEQHGTDSLFQQPDTVGMSRYLAEIDSLLRLEEQRKMEREIEALKAKQQQMMRDVDYVRLGGSKVELGPISKLIMRNSVDGFRPRMGVRTTASLHPQLFFEGYLSPSFKHKQNYFRTRVTYSFNKKKHLPDEYPQRTLSLVAMREIGMPYEILHLPNEGLFSSFHWTSVDQYVRYNRQQMDFDYDFNRLFKTSASITMQSLATAGGWTENISMHLADVRMTALFRPTSHTAISLSHCVGIDGFLRGEYNYNVSELCLRDRIAIGMGHLGIEAQAGIEWNEVPFLLMNMPSANMAYLTEPSTFMLLGNMEFANDRYVSVMLNHDFGGVLLSRIPFLRLLGCHEFVGLRSLWCSVSDKNDYGTGGTDGIKPYLECSVGIGNILGVLSVEYVRRLTYFGSPDVHRGGVRVGVTVPM